MPIKYSNEELDALKVPLALRDYCVDYLADYMKCSMLHQQAHPFNVVSANIKYCSIYNSAYAACVNERGLSDAGFMTGHTITGGE